jgi:zinc transport system substrate-binding protein
MVNKFRFCRYLLILVISFGGIIGGCGKARPAKIRVVATTSLISTIVDAVGKEKVSVFTIAPPDFCPGHFDIQPATVLQVQEGQLLLNHGWEGWFENLRSKIRNPDLHQVTLTTTGNWMIPDIQKKATDEITRILVGVDPADSILFQKNARFYKSQIDSLTVIIQQMFRNRELPKVICAEQQAPFIQWLGFPVVATYGRPEDWTAQDLARLARVIVDSGVGLIIDNLQSGPDAGKELARAAGIRQITLSNFPLAGSYLKTLMDNCQRLAEVIR